MENKNTKIKRFYTLAYRMDGYCSTIEESDDLDELLCKKKWYLEMVTRKESAINRIVILNRENIVYWDSNETDESLAAQVIELHHNTPNGIIRDADTILVDLIEENVDDLNESGIGEEIIQIWMNSMDRSSVEQLFENLAGISFHEYLISCMKNITR